MISLLLTVPLSIMVAASPDVALDVHRTSDNREPVSRLPDWHPEQLGIVAYSNTSENRLFTIEVDGEGWFDFYADPTTLGCECEPRLDFVRYESLEDPHEKSFEARFDPQGMLSRVVYDTGNTLEFFWSSQDAADVLLGLSDGSEFLRRIENPSESHHLNTLNATPDPECACPLLRDASNEVFVTVTTGGEPETDSESVRFELHLDGESYLRSGAHRGDGRYSSSLPVGPYLVTAKEWQEIGCRAVNYMVDQIIPPELRSDDPITSSEWVVEELRKLVPDLDLQFGDIDAQRTAKRILKTNITSLLVRGGLALAWNQLEDEIPACESLNWDPVVDFVIDQVEGEGLLTATAGKRYADGSILFRSDSTSFNAASGQYSALNIEFPAEEPDPICPGFGLYSASHHFWFANGLALHQTVIKYDCTFAGSTIGRDVLLDYTAIGMGCVDSDSEFLGHLPAIQAGQRFGVWRSPVSGGKPICWLGTRPLATLVYKFGGGGRQIRVAEPGYCSVCR